MKHRFYFIFPILMGFLGCSDVGTDPQQPFELISQSCMDMATGGGHWQVAIRTQAEYDSLFAARFTRPLQAYWDAHYQELLQYFQSSRPGLSDSEYAQLVRDRFYSIFPFMGTDNCSHPDIDFDTHTLLGISRIAGGCTWPTYVLSILRDDKRSTVLVNLTIQEHGSCDRANVVSEWFLVPRIPLAHDIQFNITRVQVD
jgi:hypothetical protein